MTNINLLVFLLSCGITSIALLVVLNLLLPGRVERVREKLEGHYLRSFITGLITLGVSIVICLLLWYIINLPIYGIKANETRSFIIIAVHQLIPEILTLLIILTGIGLAIASIFGLTAFADSLGRRIGNGRPSLNPTLAGAGLVVLSGLAPYLGWFIFAPVTLCISLGSTVQTLLQRKAR